MSTAIRIATVAITLILMGFTTAGVASATVIWDEASDGSLSTDRLTPTDMGTIGIGSNDVIGQTVSGISKFFSITIGAGDQLSALIVEDWQSADDIGFLGMVAGTPFNVDPASPNVGDLLGYAHYGELDVGQDILQTIGQSDEIPVYRKVLSHCTSYLAKLPCLKAKTGDDVKTASRRLRRRKTSRAF